MSTVDQIVLLARSLFDRGLTPGTTGNVSAVIGDELVITPTRSCLGRLEAEDLAHVDLDGMPRSGGIPSKELPLHVAMYRAQPSVRAVVHLHSPHAVAVSCLAGLDGDDALPALTGYHAMRLGRVPLVAYHPPGSVELGKVVATAARSSSVLLLANHGSLVGAADLESAADVAEQLEQTAQIMLLLNGQPATRVPTTEG